LLNQKYHINHHHVPKYVLNLLNQDEEFEEILPEESVILTNKNNLCFKTLNFNTGVSDCQHMISTFIKGNTPNCVNSKIQYRSFKDFDVNKYIRDLDNTVYLHDSSECVDDINTMYNDFETKVLQVIDHHAPIKYRYPRKNSVPYMNRELRKAIYKKQMLRSKFEKYKTTKTWEVYIIYTLTRIM
jgi:hypothetical protein